MILQSIVNYYEALARKGKITEPGWSPKRVSYAIILRPDGTLKELRCLKKEEERGKKKVWVPIEVTVPEPYVKARAYKSNFMCDVEAYMLCI